MKKLAALILCSVFVSGCAQNQEVYYNAVQQQNMAYMNAYQSVENESVTFDGTFTGTISIVKPKELPKLQYIEPPKSSSEIALEWAKVIVPAASMVAGLHYNYKSIDSSNKYNAKNIESWTGNFDKSSSVLVSNVKDTTNVSDIEKTQVRDTSNVSKSEVKETTNTSNTSNTSNTANTSNIENTSTTTNSGTPEQ